MLDFSQVFIHNLNLCFEYFFFWDAGLLLFKGVLLIWVFLGGFLQLGARPGHGSGYEDNCFVLEVARHDRGHGRLTHCLKREFHFIQVRGGQVVDQRVNRAPDFLQKVDFLPLREVPLL